MSSAINLRGFFSSQLACLAVKCAERQSQQTGGLYLSALRKAALVHRRNIARPEVQQGCGCHFRHFPSLVLRPAGQPYEVLLQEFAQAAPGLFYVASLVEGGAW